MAGDAGWSRNLVKREKTSSLKAGASLVKPMIPVLFAIGTPRAQDGLIPKCIGANGGKMNSREIRAMLYAKRDALSAARQSARDEIAIEKHSEELDDIQQSATRSLALNALTRHWEMTGLISQALERIESSTFGICAECEEEISEKRLRAIPWAKYCIHCQELRDRSTTDAGYAEAALRPRFAE